MNIFSRSRAWWLPGPHASDGRWVPCWFGINHILTTGYNGAPQNLAHCLDVGCLRQAENIPSGQRHELCRGIHAEQNALIQAARYGVGVDGATLYCTTQPCVICTKMLINAGVRKICYEEGYPDDLSLNMLAEAGVELIKAEAL